VAGRSLIETASLICPQMREKLLLQNAACLDEQASVDRLVRHATTLVLWMLPFQPACDLLR